MSRIRRNGLDSDVGIAVTKNKYAVAYLINDSIVGIVFAVFPEDECFAVSCNPTPVNDALDTPLPVWLGKAPSLMRCESVQVACGFLLKCLETNGGE